MKQIAMELPKTNNPFDKLQLCCDLDGTTFDEHKQVPQSSQNMLLDLNNRGAKFNIITGNDRTKAQQYTENQFKGIKVNTICSCNGAYFINPQYIQGTSKISTYKIVNEHCNKTHRDSLVFAMNLLGKIEDVPTVKIKYEKKDISATVTLDGEISLKYQIFPDISDRKFGRECAKSYNLKISKEMAVSSAEMQEVAQQQFDIESIFMSGPFSELKQVAQVMKTSENRKKYNGIFCDGGRLLQLANPNANKGICTHKLKEIAGEGSYAIGFGDELNDLEMLVASDMFVTPKNSPLSKNSQYKPFMVESSATNSMGIYRDVALNVVCAKNMLDTLSVQEIAANKYTISPLFMPLLIINDKEKAQAVLLNFEYYKNNAKDEKIQKIEQENIDTMTKHMDSIEANPELTQQYAQAYNEFFDADLSQIDVLALLKNTDLDNEQKIPQTKQNYKKLNDTISELSEKEVQINKIGFNDLQPRRTSVVALYMTPVLKTSEMSFEKVQQK